MHVHNRLRLCHLSAQAAQQLKQHRAERWHSQENNAETLQHANPQDNDSFRAIEWRKNEAMGKSCMLLFKLAIVTAFLRTP